MDRAAGAGDRYVHELLLVAAAAACLGKYSAAELLTADDATRRPLGWGAYMVDEWKAGEYIRLVKNPHYFRANEGLPKFDTLIFKVTDGYGDTNIANLKFNREPYAQFKFDVGDYQDEVDRNGCDLISSTVDMTDQVEVLHVLLHYFSDPAVKVTKGENSQATWLLSNQRSTSDGKAALFSQPEMREAAAACLKRDEAADTVFHGLVSVPNAFTFSGTSGQENANVLLNSDPEKGASLLEKDGWKSGKPRTALNVAGLADGTPLSVNYLSEDDSLSLAIAQQVKASLSECGFQVNIMAESSKDYSNKQSSESIFRGNWDMAQLTWQLPVADPCPLFAGTSIPQSSNDYTGLNFSAYANSQVDEICSQWAATPLSADRQVLREEMQTILNQDLIVVPLYTYTNLMVSRDVFCGFQTSTQSELAAIESFDYGAACR
jgi:peptide/nickel transport system substrate-binding protein